MSPMAPRLVDTHAHMEAFPRVSEVLEEARGVGVDRVVCVGGDLESSRVALELASLHGGLYPAIGLHPSRIREADLGEVVEFIATHLGGCVALGEVGLDYSYDFARSQAVRAQMREALGVLLGLAAEAGVPASIHSRNAYGDALEAAGRAGVEAVFHWFDGPLWALEALLDQGFYVSASPAVEYGRAMRANVERAPLERLLLETDSPVALRGLGRTSTPADLPRVAAEVARVKGLEVEEVARVTTRNAERLFGLGG